MRIDWWTEVAEEIAGLGKRVGVKITFAKVLSRLIAQGLHT